MGGKIVWVLLAGLSFVAATIGGEGSQTNNWTLIYRHFLHPEPILSRASESRRPWSAKDTPDPKQPPKEDTDATLESRCYSNGLVPWPNNNNNNSTTTPRKCYLLATQGPCPSGEWLVLDPSTAAPSPDCRPIPCPREDMYLWHGRTQDGGTHKCVGRESQARLCPDNAWLVNDVFGMGTCLCRPMPPHALWPRDRTCHALYTQGPCQTGQHFVPDFAHRLKKSVPEAVGRCKANPCRAPDLVQWRDGTCQRWNQTNPVCDGADNFLGVDPVTLLPNCTQDFTYTYGVRLPTRRCDDGQLDPLGICRRTFAGAYLPYGTFLNSLYNQSGNVTVDESEDDDEDDSEIVVVVSEQ